MPVAMPEFSLSKLNRANEAQAVTMIAPLIERAPDIAAQLAGNRPYSETGELAAELERSIRNLDDDARLLLLNAHPELAPPDPLAMTAESQSEQARLQLTSPTGETALRLARLNKAYRAKFGFPFIVALHRHMDVESVLSEFERRLELTRQTEIETALSEIISVSTARLATALLPEEKGRS